uniref:Uncharacterized protein n=1 Tax=Arundo donax TaxID=35708 RepID=A0A0A9FIP2_ARUDO
MITTAGEVFPTCFMNCSNDDGEREVPFKKRVRRCCNLEGRNLILC